jgi:cellulose synthase/poly-beta-1,6-N-acetylglucosamine synthase-like glycosyltransferase
MWTIAILVEAVLVPYVVAYYALNLIMIVVGAMEVGRQRKVSPALMCESALGSGILDPVSILVPAFNEELSIARTLASLLVLRYPEYEVIVVSDGSEDRTLDVLIEEYNLRPIGSQSSGELASQRVRNVYQSVRDPRLRVIDKRNGGKADALNAGINYAQYPLVLVVDADVVVHADALVHLATPFACNRATVAASGMIRPQNGCVIEAGSLVKVGLPRTLLEGIQVLEYIRAYGIGRMFFNRLNAQIIISGAFGLFPRRLLVELGGYQPHAIGEDIEIVVRLHRHLRGRNEPYEIAFSANALCLTEAPHSLRDLGRQRTRWQQGLLSTLRLHKSMAFDRRYGAAGTIAFPFFMLELFYPVAEAFIWLALPALMVMGRLGPTGAARFAIITVLAGTAVSLAAIAVEAASFSFFERRRDYLRLVLLALLEPLGYRQCTVYFRLRTFVRYYRGIHLQSTWRSPARKAPSADASARDNPI